MIRKCKYLALGCLTYVPGLHAALRRGTGGTNSARYCYSTWLRHLVMLARSGLPTRYASIAELGPGDSLGIGLTALLCGAERYMALDAVPHAANNRNLFVFDEILHLLRDRTPIPGDNEFPHSNPKLTDYSFPSHLFGAGILEKSLGSRRVERLREDLRRMGGCIRYSGEWTNEEVVTTNSLDLIFSQAVLEHIDDLHRTYAAMFQWLKPGGVISHQIDFKCHEMSDVWNGHLGYSDFVWRLMRGRLPYLLNRRACSEHLAMAASVGFEVVSVARVVRSDGLPRNRLATRFRHLTDEDLVTAGAFLLCRKPTSENESRSSHHA